MFTLQFSSRVLIVAPGESASRQHVIETPLPAALIDSPCINRYFDSVFPGENRPNY